MWEKYTCVWALLHSSRRGFYCMVALALAVNIELFVSLWLSFVVSIRLQWVGAFCKCLAKMSKTGKCGSSDEPSAMEWNWYNVGVAPKQTFGWRCVAFLMGSKTFSYHFNFSFSSWKWMCRANLTLNQFLSFEWWLLWWTFTFSLNRCVRWKVIFGGIVLCL